jgi:dTDP-4-dehydrorhamnose reductase
MRILITGGLGLLGRELVRTLGPHHLVRIADLPETDITQARLLIARVRAFRPDLILHAAAATDVDGCESDPDRAFRINAVGSAHVAHAADQIGARLIAFSTDYVFDGASPRPYHEWDVPSPRTVYGASKLAGEEAIRTHCPNHVILRIAWLYGPGGPSFLHTILGKARQPGPPLRVVNDQRGNPTSTRAVADLVTRLLEEPVVGLFHATCEGEATWYDLARAALAEAGLSREVIPCTTAEFPRPAPRPANSRLEKRRLRLQGFPPMPDWRDELARFLRDHPTL